MDQQMVSWRWCSTYQPNMAFSPTSSRCDRLWNVYLVVKSGPWREKLFLLSRVTQRSRTRKTWVHGREEMKVPEPLEGRLFIQALLLNGIKLSRELWSKFVQNFFFHFVPPHQRSTTLRKITENPAKLKMSAVFYSTSTKKYVELKFVVFVGVEFGYLQQKCHYQNQTFQ